MEYQTTQIDTFLSRVASERITPAGGSCAAVVGATGAALCEMACIHTVGAATDDERTSKTDETAGSVSLERDDIPVSDVGEDIAELAAVGTELRRRRRQLLRLAERDAAAVDTLFDSDTDDRGAALKRSTGVPLTVAEACLDVVESAAVVTTHCSRTVLPDAGTGTLFADAALRAAVHTVRTNVETIDEASFVETVTRRADEVESTAATAVEEVETNLGW